MTGSDSKQPYFIHPMAVVEEDVVIGPGTKIWHFVHIRSGARIGSNCILGKGVYVDAGVTVGDGVHLQNFVCVYRAVQLEDEVFVGPHATFTNDPYPRSGSSYWEPVPTIVRRGASISANATIICGVTLGKYAMVGAGAVVTSDIPEHGLVYGNPARLYGFVCKCGQSLSCPKPAEVGGQQTALTCPRCGEQTVIARSLLSLLPGQTPSTEPPAFL